MEAVETAIAACRFCACYAEFITAYGVLVKTGMEFVEYRRFVDAAVDAANVFFLR